MRLPWRKRGAAAGNAAGRARKRPRVIARVLAGSALLLIAAVFGHGLVVSLSGPKEGAPGRDGAPTGYTYDLTPLILEIGPHRFVVPRGYLYAYDVGKTRQRSIGIQVMLPDFEPISPSNSACFADQGTCNDIFWLGLSPGRGVPAEQQLANVLRGAEDNVRPAYGFAQHLNTTFGRRAEIYTSGEGHELLFLDCDTPDELLPSCSQERPLGDGLVLWYYFRRVHLAEWPDIERKAMALIARFEGGDSP